MIQNAWYVARRELGSIFAQPIAYIFSVMLLLIVGLIFSDQISFPLISGGPPATMEPVLGTFSFLMLFASPAITMRLLSEEQQSGTIELLMTLPLRDSEVVLGKWLAAFITYLLTVALTLVFPFILIQFGNPDVNIIITGYLGVILWGAGLLAIGVLGSAMSENQINAFMLTFGISLALYLSFVPAGQITGTSALATGFSTFLEELSYQAHLANMLQGLVTVADVLYYLIITVVALFAATRLLESRRWR